MKKSTIDNWEKKLDLALKTGRGKFGGCTFIGDIFLHKKLIALIRAKQYTKAADFAFEMETNPRETIPTTVWNFLEKEDCKSRGGFYS